MLALPSNYKPTAVRLRLSAAVLLEKASAVESTAGKVAFGETVGAVWDNKKDYAKQVASRQNQ